jgi:hypothetical protein
MIREILLMYKRQTMKLVDNEIKTVQDLYYGIKAIIVIEQHMSRY